MYNNKSAGLMAEAASYLKMKRVLFICTGDCRDEVTLDATTAVFEFKEGTGTTSYNLNPADFGYPDVAIGDLFGNTPEYNAGVIYDLLKNPERDGKFCCCRQFRTCLVLCRSIGRFESMHRVSGRIHLEWKGI
ncbi:MAG: hypothetical protein IPG53_05985 [Ignavibacteriales bacterium]|nr:hypothetical protein [Ignavibacteriales bacterium]